jgi:hypothetical protein
MHNIANIPKVLFEAASHSRGHADGAVDPGKIVPARAACAYAGVIFLRCAVR